MSVSPELRSLIRRALREDAAWQDGTSRLVLPRDRQVRARIFAKQELVVGGVAVARQTFRELNPKIQIRALAQDGECLTAGQTLLEISGSARGILAGERVALNFLQHLSGIATLTRAFVNQVRGTKAKILDTRKTIPGLRFLERQAVVAGGGVNHRFDLASGVMVKDNHWALVKDWESLFARLKKVPRKIPVVIEVETLAALRRAIDLGAQYLQLDNMSVHRLREAVEIAQGRCLLEATGGVNLKNVARIAATGVDFISIGALTHSAGAVDVSLEVLSI